MSRDGAGAIAANFDLILDERVGIVSRLEELPRDAAGPDFIHVAARTCDPAALGGAPGPFSKTAAAIAREAAVGKAIRLAVMHYCAAFYQRDQLSLASVAEAGFRCVKPGDFTLYSLDQYDSPGFPFIPFDEKTPVRWARAVDLATGETVHVPAPFVWYPYSYFRAGGDLPIGQSTTGGLACGEGAAAATLAGLYDVVARDALAIFWQSRTAVPQIRVETLPEALAEIVRRFTVTGDRVAILDITTNNRLPTFAAMAISDQVERPAFAFGAAAGLDPRAAIAEALAELAEARRLAEEAKRVGPLPAAANDWEDVAEPLDHLAFAADHRNRDIFAFAASSEDRRNLVEYDDLSTGSVELDLEACVSRVVATGHRAYAANLTSEDVASLGLNVVRILVPGYQPLFVGHKLRALGGERLYDVPQKLGYRGIDRGTVGNPAPHPFRAG